MVMNGWLTSLLFHANLSSHSCDKAISDSDLETSKSRSWVWSKSKVIQSAQYLINLLPFRFTPIRPTIPEIQLFRNLNLKNLWSRSWVRSKVKITEFTQYTTDALLFFFYINQTNHSWNMNNLESFIISSSSHPFFRLGYCLCSIRVPSVFHPMRLAVWPWKNKFSIFKEKKNAPK